jgi:hypothetical protein
VVGLGAHDDVEQARGFVADTGVTHPMVWDPTGRSWRELGIAFQPASVLLAPDGRRLATFRTGLELDEIAALLPR